MGKNEPAEAAAAAGVMAKDWPPTEPGPGRRRGACFTRVESVARSLALSCAGVVTRARWAR